MGLREWLNWKHELSNNHYISIPVDDLTFFPFSGFELSQTFTIISRDIDNNNRAIKYAISFFTIEVFSAQETTYWYPYLN